MHLSNRQPTGAGKRLPLFLCGALLLASAGKPSQAAGKKPFPRDQRPKNALSIEPKTWVFSLKGGIMTPREGALESAPMLSLEGQYIQNEKARIAIQLDLAKGDVETAPGRTKEGDQKYVHVSYRLQPLQLESGQVYYGGGLTTGSVKAKTGGTANGHGVNLFLGYVWRSGFLVETRYSLLSSEKQTDVGGLAIEAGYQF